MATATTTTSQDPVWHKTACILCPENCGLEVQLEERHITKIRGDKAHPHSAGYLCQKASRLDYYQNGKHRIQSPLRRREDGTFEEISWDTAVAEIAAKLLNVRDEHGGHTFAYVGGGGQGNHLSGVFSSALKKTMRSRYHYSSLAQEKTGGFWTNGHLFGRQSCYPSNDVANADFVMFLGTNPWQSHGFPHARLTLQKIAKDPNRTMVTVDPWRTKTAAMSDVHLQVKPGRDAFLFSAMLAILFTEDLIDAGFIEKHTVGAERLREVFSAVPIDKFIRFAGLDPNTVRDVTRKYARTAKASIRADLGLEHTLHSTLNDYLGKLLYLVTGHFGREGTNHLLTQFLPLIGHSGEAASPKEGGKYWKTAVTGMPERAGLFPPNVLPQEINTDHPDRLRAVWVDSMNPLVTAADTNAYEKAFRNLDILVVVDVALTETAQLADYVLPAASQYEKWEATFFGAGVPHHVFHLRKPLFEPLEGTLPETEIYRRVLLAMGETPKTQPLLGAIDQVNMMAPQYRDASDNFKSVAAPLFLGSQTFASKNKDAVERAGFKGNGKGHAFELFEAIAGGESGVVIGEFEYEETWGFIRHADHKIHLAIDELLTEVGELEKEIDEGRLEDDGYPFILSAGGRRSFNANTIYRNPEWRREDPEGAMWIHPEDLAGLGLPSGAKVVVESKHGSIVVTAEANEDAQRGVLGLPHGYGLTFPDEQGRQVQHGPRINRLTSSDYCDPIAKTPYHKNLPARLRAAQPADLETAA
jgi:anaerobic selenocysteine-containing dehydrogenase